MNQSTRISLFDRIRHEDERGKEYWSARGLGKLLGYSSWQSFQNTLVKAREACVHNNQYALEHFYLQIDVVRTGNGSLRKKETYRLSRYACYLIIQNADPFKLIVAVGQTYFAYEARRQEVVDMLVLTKLAENLKQDVIRFQLYTYDFNLKKAAQETWAVEPGDFAIFFNHGYKGLIG